MSKKSKLNKTSGITLIALVLTIITLIIIATISINAVFGDNGLIKKAEQAREKQALSEELERLELIKVEVLTDEKNKGKISVDIYVNELITKGIVDASDVTVESDGSKTVVTDAGHKINISPDGNTNVRINEKLEYEESLEPEIIGLWGTYITTSEIEVTISAKNAENYDIQYKKESETNYIKVYSGKNNKYRITGLSENELYNIKVIATNKYGSHELILVEKTFALPEDKLRGAFIKYDVEYTDTYKSYDYTSTNGWRLLSYEIDEKDSTGKTLKNVKLISTGIPAMMRYRYDDTSNNYSQWVTKVNKENDTDSVPNLTTFYNNVLGGTNYTIYSQGVAASDYKALQASAGFYYNLGSMTFTQGTDYSTYNMGYYTKVKNGSTEYTSGSTTGNNLFVARNDASIRMLTLPELNADCGQMNPDDVEYIGNKGKTDIAEEFTDIVGLYQLSNISIGTKLGDSYEYDAGGYWLASPWRGTDSYSNVCLVTYTGQITCYSGLMRRTYIWCTSSSYFII